LADVSSTAVGQMKTPIAITHRLYCDEAGNTGANYLDSQQPVMVFASWMVACSAESALLEALRDLTAGSQAREVHAHRLLARSRGWSRAAKFISAAEACGCVPFFYVVEKRHQLAERIVHSLLDPETNPRALGVPVLGSPEYGMLVEHLYHLPESAMTAFAKAVSRPTEDLVRNAINAIVAALLPLDVNLARAVSGCLENLAEVIESDFSDRNGFRHAQLTSPHLPGVMRMLEAVDAYAEKSRFGAIDVLHDETSQFGEVLAGYTDLFAGVGSHGKIPSIAPTLPPIGFAHVRSLRTAPSHERGGIQAADVLATSIVQIVRIAASREVWNDHQAGVARQMFARLLDEDLTHGGITASSSYVEGLRSRLLSARTNRP
jgi:hypothetical protein